MTLVLDEPFWRFRPKNAFRCSCGWIGGRASVFAQKQKNGVLRYKLRCIKCGEIEGYNIPHDALSASEKAEIEILIDNYDGKPCVRCGSPSGEDHHTSPSAAFGMDAETWPIIRLCSQCHAKWHATMDAYYRGRFQESKSNG